MISDINWWSDLTEWATKIVNNFEAMPEKDKFVILTGIVSVFISTSSALISLISYRQKGREGAYALRKQLSDTMQKILDLNMESAKRNNDPDKYPRNFGGLINDQRRFHARVALSLMGRIGPLVSRWEYQLAARAFADLSDLDTAKSMYLIATKSRSSPVEDATVLRGYGRFLFQSGEVDSARVAMEDAVAYLSESDNLAHERGFTYELWAEHELDFGYLEVSQKCFNLALREYSDDLWVHRGAKSVERLELSDMKRRIFPDQDPVSQMELF
ncbi:hypothetical protein [Methylobacterium sp. Leaf88]|uniref:hypothetical protein n=1 Tax=Methylobacterium sp. Leaf88 TaxID=1736244 RepID=UPI000AB50953|nr:hypothetical protein [Methylobacterium sp. Leaf88]